MLWHTSEPQRPTPRGRYVMAIFGRPCDLTANEAKWGRWRT